MRWTIRAFEELSGAEVYELLGLRAEVFVVEQNCVYRDVDGLDGVAFHVMGREGEALVACARLLPAGVTFEEVTIGRVVVAQSARGRGLGKQLMEVSLEGCVKLYGDGAIMLGGQRYLKRFYEGFGFRQMGENYLEDGIEHLVMRRD